MAFTCLATTFLCFFTIRVDALKFEAKHVSIRATWQLSRDLDGFHFWRLIVQDSYLFNGWDQLASQAISWGTCAIFPNNLLLHVHEVLLRPKVLIFSWSFDVLTGVRKRFAVGVAARRRFCLMRRWRKPTIVLRKTPMSWTAAKKILRTPCSSIHRMLCLRTLCPGLMKPQHRYISPTLYPWELFVHLLPAVDDHGLHVRYVDCVLSLMVVVLNIPHSRVLTYVILTSLIYH